MTRLRTNVLRALTCAAAALTVAACGHSVGGPSASTGAGPSTTYGAPGGAGGSAGASGGGGVTAGAAGGAGLTFGTQPCGRLVAFEEIAAATGLKPAVVDVVTPTQCNYEDQSGNGIMSVDRTTDPAGQATCGTGGGSTEPLIGLGDSANWSEVTRTLCFVKGVARVHITLGAHVADAKTTTVGLATKAVSRLP